MGYLSCDPAERVEEHPLNIEWEETSCLLCESRNWAQLLEAPAYAPPSVSPPSVGGRYRGGGLWFAVVQCQRCGLCFTNPRPSQSSIAQFYPEDYAPHQELEVQRLDREYRRWPIPRRRRERRQVLPWQGKGRLLDFGCGSGSFLARMRRQGWKVTGIDVSTVAIHRIRRGLGLPVLQGTLPHPELEAQSFDVITMRQSLEHVHHPRETLRQAFRLLVAGGKLLVIVPNIDSLAFRWFGPAWYGLDLPRHLTHFTPTTLPVMMEQAGFRVGPVRMVRHSHWLRSSAQLAMRPPSVSPPSVGGRYRGGWRRWLISKPLSRLATWYGFLTYQADCIMVTGMK